MNWIEDLVARARHKSDLTARLLPKISPIFEELKERLKTDMDNINSSVGSEIVRFGNCGPLAISLSCATGEVMSVVCFNDGSLQLEIEISAADEEISKHFLPVLPSLNGESPVFTERNKPATIDRISQLMIQPLVEYSLQLHEFERPDEFEAGGWSRGRIESSGYAIPFSVGSRSFNSSSSSVSAAIISITYCSACFICVSRPSLSARARSASAKRSECSARSILPILSRDVVPN